ncbi:MAG: arsinothricin resistance N-acetyltransferase ArsN1 family B [Gemmatimonadota bacterium]
MIRTATLADADALARIYNHYITDTIVTFEEEPIDGAEMAARLADVVAARLPWIVAEEGGVVVGYAYASRWKARVGYRFSVESTIYLAQAATGKGIGTALYQSLLDLLREGPTHLVIGGIGLPNPASVALHERLGFEKVAQFKEVGIKFGTWIDVGYWQLKLKPESDRGPSA